MCVRIGQRFIVRGPLRQHGAGGKYYDRFDLSLMSRTGDNVPRL